MPPGKAKKKSLGHKNPRKKESSKVSPRASRGKPLLPNVAQVGSPIVSTPTGDSSRSFQSLCHIFLALLALVTGIYSCFRGSLQIGLGLIATFFVLTLAGPIFKNMGSVSKFGLVILGWVLVGEAFSAVRDYSDILPQGLILHSPSQAGLLFLIGFALMYLGFRYAPDSRQENGDLKPWQAWLGLTVFLGFSAWTTWANLDVPGGFYCDDAAASTNIIIDYKDLHHYYLIDGYGQKETGAYFLTAFLWNFFPDETAIRAQRIGGELIALVNLWLMYLLGKEVLNRKTGLLLVAIGTVSNWIPWEVVLGIGVVSATLAVSWSLLALLRLFKNPTWFRFAHWALAIAFGTYMYPAFRLFGLFLVLAVFLWLILKGKDWRTGRAGWFLASLLSVFWLSCTLVKNRFLNDGLIQVLSSPWVLWAFFILLVGALVKSIENYRKDGRDEIFLKWAVSLFLIALLVFPMVNHKDYGLRLSVVNPLTHGTNSIGALLAKIATTLRAHFMGQGYWEASAFDFQTAWVIILGVAAFLAKPNGMTLLLFAGVWVGLAPHFLPEYSYDGRSAASITPFFLLAAIALEHLQVWGQQIWGRKLWNVFFTSLLLGFFAWQARTSYGLVYKNQIYSQGGGLEALVSREVIKDSPENRVYLSLLAYCSSPAVQGILDEGHPLYVLHGNNSPTDNNPIYLSPAEKPKDVVVIVFKGDLKLKERLEKDFPRAQWTGINLNTFHYPTANPVDTAPRIYRVWISADQITNDPKKLIYFSRSPKNAWIRDFYWGAAGPTHASIYSEDRVASLRDAFPTQVEINTASFDGAFQAPVDGIYEFSIKTGSTVTLWVNHKKMIDLKPGNAPLAARNKIYLAKGSYPVRYGIYFRDGNFIPEIQVQVPGSSQIRELDSFTH